MNAFPEQCLIQNRQGLVMDLLSSNAVRVFITVFVVLFCGGLVPRVEGQMNATVSANRGAYIIIYCYPPRSNYEYYCWYKDADILACFLNGDLQYFDSNILQSFTYNYSQSRSQYSLNITDINYDDSATYQCYYGNGASARRGERYDLRVIECSCNVTDHQNPEYGKVVCELINYVSPSVLNVIVIINEKPLIVVAIDGKDFSFPISRSELYSDLKVEINSFGALGSVVCTVPAQLTSPQPSTHLHTSLPTPTTRNRRIAASPTASEEFTADAPTKHHTPPNEISSIDNNTGTDYTTLVIVIIGLLFLLVLIVIIIVVIHKKTKNRHKSKPNRNVSIDNQVMTKQQPEGDYELNEDESRKEPEYTNSIEMLRKSHKDGKYADYLSIDVPTANVPHEYMALIHTSSRSTENETADNQTCAMAEYVNSSIRDQPKWKGVSPQPEDQYDDVSIPEIRDDGDKNLVYSDIQ